MDEAAKNIVDGQCASSVGRDTKPFVFCASAIAERRRQRLLRSDGRQMRFPDHAVVAILLHVTQPSVAAIYRQRQPYGTGSSCHCGDFATLASTASSYPNWKFNIYGILFPAVEST
jgi:hypothetical protein